tara:strand:- start:614547 stop:615695 length:1149 start_codon:yes stop_codon:yes gene_type:complete
MGRINVVFWMNMPSHHQTSFFEALHAKEEIDLEVRYYDRVSLDRKKLGWNVDFNLPSNQQFVENNDLELALQSLSDWKERIHIVPGFSHPFLKILLDKLIVHNVKWIHWSERSGKPFTKLLNYNYDLINFLMPLYYFFKGYRAHAIKINKHALGAFAISDLAKRDFIKWGVKEKKIRILNYSLKALNKSESKPVSNLIEGDFKLFMYVGVLTPHKGIDLLIEAFSKLKNKHNWMLILIGNDLSKGDYKKSIQKLNLEKQVLLLGTINSTLINEYIDNCDVFVLPTLFDGWGAVLNEAASLGKPLISTDQCGSAFHLIEDGMNGFQVKAKSVNELNMAMQYYIDSEDMIVTHGKHSGIIFNNNIPERNAGLFKSYIFELTKDI